MLRDKLCEADCQLILERYRRVAIVGLSDDPDRPSWGVGHYLLEHGFEVFPVNPTISETLGLRAYASLDEVPGPLEIVDVFRRREHVPQIVDDAIRLGAKAVWLQVGVSDAAAEQRARDAGLAVVHNRCLKVEHLRRSAA
jgi:predicted CoA-binding protein